MELQLQEIDKPLVSVCIATYNRENELLELVNSLLTLKRKDFNIVVTDNCSTDRTVEKLKAINDNRIKVRVNKTPIAGVDNMIQAIFNGNGKYIFYCNDRDLIVLNGFLHLLNILEQYNLVFIQTRAKGKSNAKEELRIFSKGYSSLVHQGHAHHPTGMVFNGDILKSKLDIKTYFEYLHIGYSYSFMAVDLFQYGDSAIFECACWDTRSQEWISENISGTLKECVPFFYPETSIRMVKAVLQHVLKQNNYEMSDKEITKTAEYYLEFFCQKLMEYKYGMYDIYMTKHYGIAKRFISTYKMVKIFENYFSNSLGYLEEEKYPRKIVEMWKRKYSKLCKDIIIRSLKADYVFIKYKV